MDRHRPGSSARPKVTRRLARAAAGAVAWTALGRFERAAFKLLDGVVVIAEGAGWLFSNAAPYRGPDPRGGAALIADAFPDADTPARLPTAAHRVEATRRPARLDRAAARGVRVNYAEDDGVARTALRRRNAPAVKRLRAAGVEWLAAAPRAEKRAAQIARILGVPVAPAPETATTAATTSRASGKSSTSPPAPRPSSP
jgi:hypothetical protein